MNYAEMNTTELRKLVRERGLAKGAAVASARKDELIPLLNGDISSLNSPTLASTIDLADVIAQAISGKVNAGMDEDVVRDIANDVLSAWTNTDLPEILESVTGSIRHTTIVMPERAEEIELGTTPMHYQLPQVLAWLRSDVPVWLWGQPGGGKTHLGRQIAGIMGVEAYVMSIDETTTANKLLGFQNLVSGEFIKGWLYEPFKNGGLAVIDEMDTGNPGIIAALNALLANSHYMFPNGETVERHKDFCVLACANTNGTGAVAGFTARHRLDAATLDRFAIVKFEYDEGLEMQIACGVQSETELWKPAKELPSNETCIAWVNWVQSVRALCKNSVLISPRPSLLGVRALRAGIPIEDVAESLVLALCATDTRVRILNECGKPEELIATQKERVA